MRNSALDPEALCDPEAPSPRRLGEHRLGYAHGGSAFLTGGCTSPRLLALRIWEADAAPEKTGRFQAIEPAQSKGEGE
jgi:hypothetical protein